MKKALIAALIIGATGFALSQSSALACKGTECRNEYDIFFTVSIPKILEFNIFGLKGCGDTIQFDFLPTFSDLVTSDPVTGYWKASNSAYRAWLSSNVATGRFAPSDGKVPRIAILSNVPGWKLAFMAHTDLILPANFTQNNISVQGKATKGSLGDFPAIAVGPTAQTLVDAGSAGQGLTEYDLHFSYLANLTDTYDFGSGMAVAGMFSKDLVVTLVNPT